MKKKWKTGERRREEERERERKKASAAAPSTCLAAPSGVTNLNGTLCAPIASACLLILTLQRRRRRRRRRRQRRRLTGFLSATCTRSACRMPRCSPLITIAFKFPRFFSRDRVFFPFTRKGRINRKIREWLGEIEGLSFFFFFFKALHSIEEEEDSPDRGSEK